LGVSRLVVAAVAALAVPAVACEAPAESATPLRALITRVKHLPETEAWLKTLPEGATAQYVLRVDAPEKVRGRCYWPVEVRAGGELWRRFLVTADGTRVLAR
jgi:hypothetical protein